MDKIVKCLISKKLKRTEETRLATSQWLLKLNNGSLRIHCNIYTIKYIYEVLHNKN